VSNKKRKKKHFLSKFITFMSAAPLSTLSILYDLIFFLYLFYVGVLTAKSEMLKGFEEKFSLESGFFFALTFWGMEDRL
jgi:hypothetical protein